MALFNYTAKEITLKVVYYGPGFSGKTTNLQYLHSILPTTTRGKLISLTTEADRTLFFDFLPVDLGKIKDFNIRFQLYTVPGQVRYNATRRLVLKGADAVVFVADSQKEMEEQNIESFTNMSENLTVNNIDPDDIPVVFQYNKRDIQNVMGLNEMNNVLNKKSTPFFEAVAVEGKGVRETFNEVTDYLIKHIAKKYKVDIESPSGILLSNSEQVVSSPHPHTVVPPAPSFNKLKIPVPSQHAELTKPASPVTLDLSGLVSAIGELTGVMTEIKDTLKETNKKQTKISNELFEIKQIFLEAKEKKGFRKFFK